MSHPNSSRSAPASSTTWPLNLHRLLILSLLGWFCSGAAAATLEPFAGYYVGHRIERWSYPTHEVRHYDELSFYGADGSYWTRLQAEDGTVYYQTGSIAFNADGSWESDNGPHWRADFRGDTLTVFIDWRPFNIGAVVQSMTHRVESIPVELMP